MSDDVLGFDEIDKRHIAIVGGKGAHLGQLSRMGGIHVPTGFCVTTGAFRRMMEDTPSMAERLDRLSRLRLEDSESIRSLSAETRDAIEQVVLADDLQTSISQWVGRLDKCAAYAVRSSATTEDLPGASVAGQHDTYLNVVGPAAVIQHLKRCWASLFTERAVTYRLHHGFDHRQVQMAVVIQQMVFPQSAGILFTADPATSNRKIITVEASFGLGDAVVSGRVNPDVYLVRGGEIVAKSVAVKEVASEATPGGGTQVVAIPIARQQFPALTDEQVILLAQLGRKIEAHFGRPQDIEWCWDDDGFHIVQSRPITSLFPVPSTGDSGNHVFVSVGHQQMMTAAMKPLGIAFWQMTSFRPMYEGGGRLFVDVAPELASATRRTSLLEVMRRADPLIADALHTIIQRGDLISMSFDTGPTAGPAGGDPEPIKTDPAIVLDLIERTQASIVTLQREIATKSGSALLEFISTDIAVLRRILFDRRSHQVFMSAMEATWWLNDQLEAWLGEKNAADALTQSVPHNITSQMGLALLEVADAIRPYPDVVAFLQETEDEGFLDRLGALEGGQVARDAIRSYLENYGMRCVGEIDITNPRWSERPSTLVPLILGNVKNAKPGAGAHLFEQGRQKAWAREQELLARLRELPDGERKSKETKEKIDRVRTFIGYREYPKYGMVSRYFVYKQAMLAEADRLVHAGVLSDREDIFFLSFEELQEVVRERVVDDELIAERKADFRFYERLTPPRVLTSDGEVVSGRYNTRDVPPGALIGVAVSAGRVEGRARIVHEMAGADLAPGDILVTVHTDPSWSPAFLAVTGLVTEVGGLMTHGAVVAREYGLPAVVGVEGASKLIRDGQKIRIDGTRGYVEVLS